MQSGREPSKLIVADRDLARAQAAAAFFARHGFEARALDDGGEAILAAETWPADAAVLSIPLASISGLDVARHLRQSFGPSFRLVGCSPAADGALLRRLIDAGFDQVVASTEPPSILAALGEATRVLVQRSMRQTVRRIELLVVLGHSLLGARSQSPAPGIPERVARIIQIVRHDLSLVEIPKERERLAREIGALAERVPDDRVTRL